MVPRREETLSQLQAAAGDWHSSWGSLLPPHFGQYCNSWEAWCCSRAVVRVSVCQLRTRLCAVGSRELSEAGSGAGRGELAGEWAGVSFLSRGYWSQIGGWVKSTSQIRPAPKLRRFAKQALAGGDGISLVPARAPWEVSSVRLPAGAAFCRDAQ